MADPPCPRFSLYNIRSEVSIETWAPSDICIAGAWVGSLHLLLLIMTIIHLAYSFYRFYQCSKVADLRQTLQRHHGIIYETTIDLIGILVCSMYLAGYTSTGLFLSHVWSTSSSSCAIFGSYHTMLKLLEPFCGNGTMNMGVQRYRRDIKRVLVSILFSTIFAAVVSHYFFIRDFATFNIVMILYFMLHIAMSHWHSWTLSRALSAFEVCIMR
jgi:hypothetical protein